MLQIKNITGGYRPEQNILYGIDLEIKQGEALAVIGQNGAGKSTLAKAIVNTLPYKKGTVKLQGKNISKKSVQAIINSGLAYFLQGGQVFPHLTVKENLLFAAGDMGKANFNQRFTRLKSYFEIFDKINMRTEASYLSGGEKHQLALAMVLFRQPGFLILDEPSAGLSPANVQIMYDTLNKLRQDDNITLMLIEQNVEKALEFADRVALLKIGKIEKTLSTDEVGTIEDINRFYFS